MLEFDFIGGLLRPLSGEGARMLHDDCAQLPVPPSGQRLITSVDATVMGVHIPEDAPVSALAEKGLARALSDLAANGATPCGYLLALGIDRAWTESHLRDFADALAATQERFDTRLLGGDTILHPDRAQAIFTVFGSAPDGALQRRAAVTGDDVWLAGELGQAAIGYHHIRTGAPASHAALEAYWRPLPPVAFAAAAASLAHAAIDISDGLLADLHHMAIASSCTIALDQASLPLPDELPDGLDRNAALTFGDDYAVALTAAPDCAAALRALADTHRLRLTRIGKVVQGPSVGVIDAATMETITPRGFSHF